MSSALAESGWGERSIERILDFIEAMPGDPPTIGAAPTERLLGFLLEEQGVDAVAAQLLARMLKDIDFRKLTTTTGIARELLDVSYITITRYTERDDEPIRPMADHKPGGIGKMALFWLPDFAWVARWRDEHPQSFGRGVTWWPERV